MGNVVDVRREMTKTKEQLEEEKKISLSIRIRPLELDGNQMSKWSLCNVYRRHLSGMDQEDLRGTAKDLWVQIVKLETERYDLEERTRRQDYDVSWLNNWSSGSSYWSQLKELKERQRQQNKQKAIKLGLDPE